MIMRKSIAALLIGTGLLGLAGTAAARTNIDVGIAFGYPAPVYAPPPPVVYYPRPVYVEPPVYYRPAPVYYGPPAYAYYGPRWRHDHGRHGGWDNRGWDRR
jgi:hypothetical protein